MKWLSDSKLSHLREVVGNPDFSGTKYTFVKELARGGMGTVYVAEDTELNRQVAIKVLSATEISVDLRRRMIREAQIIARLEHPGIVPVHDVGELPDGRVFYAMKLVRGVRLDEYAANTSSTRERLRKFQAVCDAVAFAHAHGVIHRDLKPQNIMIGSFGEVLVLDWGVAKILRDDPRPVASEADTLILPGPDQPKPNTTSETSQGTVIGTRQYMSPEQARGEVDRLDERSDIYSLGAVFYFFADRSSSKRRQTACGESKSDENRRSRLFESHGARPVQSLCQRCRTVGRRESIAGRGTGVSLSRERLRKGQPVGQ